MTEPLYRPVEPIRQEGQPAPSEIVYVELPPPEQPPAEKTYVYIPPERRLKPEPPGGMLKPGARQPAQPDQQEIIQQPEPKTIRGNNSEPELFEPAQPAPKAAVEPYKKNGKIGRKRRYEEIGPKGEYPVRFVVLYRYHKGRHWPGMSEDMQKWYDHYYFTRPSKAKDGKDYERHVKAYERRRKWIAEETGSQQATPALGHSRNVISYRRRAHR